MGGGVQAKPIPPNGDEEFEVLDIRGTAKDTMTWLERFAHDLTQEPVAKQVAVGGASGWVVGYLSMKVGKMAAMVVGGSLIMLQLASYKGYIQVDWKRLNKDLEKNAKALKREVETNISSKKSNQVVRFAQENAVLASSFGGGVLLGIASS